MSLTVHLPEELADRLTAEAARRGLTVAENLNIVTIATLNRRDFNVVRPRHIDAFELLP